MLSKLMKVNTAQEEIIIKLIGIINELFILLCNYTNLDIEEGLEPLLNSMKDAAEMTDKL